MGDVVGFADVVGTGVGSAVGSKDGAELAVGAADGTAVGTAVGAAVGGCVGAAVGLHSLNDSRHLECREHFEREVETRESLEASDVSLERERALVQTRCKCLDVALFTALINGWAKSGLALETRERERVGKKKKGPKNPRGRRTPARARERAPRRARCQSPT